MEVPEYHKTRYKVNVRGVENLILIGNEYMFRFALITACNPFGRKSSPALNENGMRVLAQSLAMSGYEFYKALGEGIDGWDSEPMFLVVNPDFDWIHREAMRWRQVAYVGNPNPRGEANVIYTGLRKL